MATGNSLNADEAGVQTYSTTTGNLTGSTTTQYNVIVGDANNKLANVAPSATSGVPLISSGSSVNPAFGTAVVAGGGTGNTTFTAYSVITAGTTATGAFQNVSGVGTSGQVLTSNGASALPAWQTPAGGGGYAITNIVGTGNPADSTTYYLCNALTLTDSGSASSAGINRYYIPIDGTITKVYGGITCTAGSSEGVTVAIRLNDTTNTNISTSINLSGTDVAFSNTSLNISFVAGDFINVLFIAPAWTSNPTSVKMTTTILVE